MFKRQREVPIVARSKSKLQLQLAWLLIVLGVLAGGGAGFLWVQQSKADVPPPLPQLLAPQENQAPAKVSKPSAKVIASYHVAPTLPKFLSIPAIGISKVRVLSLGLTKDNRIAVPTNSYDTGWYNASAKPGQSGAMFIYGHVAGWNQGGVFYNLKKLKPGNKIIVTRGDNTTYTYQVKSLKLHPAKKVDMNAVLAPVDPSKPGLNLMTCTWNIVNGKSQFNNRRVVFSSLVSKS